MSTQVRNIAELIAEAKENKTYNDPYAGINFVEFHPIIKDRDGNIVFSEKVIFPDYFDINSVKIVASKYLCNDSKYKEKDLRVMIDRVSDTITDFGIRDGYFASEIEALAFNYKLKFYQIYQYFAFNSPVYFNIGVSEGKPQSAACFVLDVEDNMHSISKWLSNESQIFKGGSGAGINLSKLRSSKERVRGGGFASGPISFLKSSDVAAGVIKSGGTFRRSAKLACLNIDHPDIVEFIRCKVKEEEKLRILKEAGIIPNQGYELSDEVFFQNTNISVRITDAFMNAVLNGDKWETKAVIDGSIIDTYDAKDLLLQISEMAWKTADPGVMFHDNTNKWNNIANTTITAANPCIEFTPSTTNQSCNLASMNDYKFFDGHKFDNEMFEDVVETVIFAQDILVDNSSYPVEEIAKQTKFYRALGLGFTNFGALLMILGYPYDSDEARSLASFLSAYRTGLAFKTSMKIASIRRPGDWWSDEANQKQTLKVFNMHKDHLKMVKSRDTVPNNLRYETINLWEDLTGDHFKPISNAQVTLVAPTGTISFLMGASTFGIEPDFSLIKFKTLSGNDGAVIKVVNDTVETALINLGYDKKTTDLIITDMIDKGIPLEKSTHIRREHIAIFDTAVAPENGSRSINYMAHVDMLAAVQPFISMSISKTVNMPNSVTVEDIYNVYFEAWRKGLKSISIYRDGSKVEQVLNASSKKIDKVDSDGSNPTPLPTSFRKKMPTKRKAEINKFTIHGMNGSLEGYLTRGLYPNGDLGEVFIELAKDGTTVKGLVGAIVTITSIALQYGVPLSELVEKMIHRRFEPSGWVKGDEYVKNCVSIVDYIFKHLAHNHLDDDKLIELGLKHPYSVEDSNQPLADKTKVILSESFCPKCGTQLRKLGSCDFCESCSWQSGGCS